MAVSGSCLWDDHMCVCKYIDRYGIDIKEYGGRPQEVSLRACLDVSGLNLVIDTPD